MQKHRFGAPNVHYTSDGRAVYGQEQADNTSYQSGRGHRDNYDRYREPNGTCVQCIVI